MNEKTPDNRPLLIIPCSCPNYTSRLTQKAAQILAEIKQLRLADAMTSEGLQLINSSNVDGDPVIAVDGCQDRCIKRELDRHRLFVDFYLNLVDLGIEEFETGSLDTGDLELVQDAIIAFSTRKNDQFPRFNSGCCC